MGYSPWGHKELGKTKWLAQFREDLLIYFFKDNGLNVICITCLHVNLHPGLEQCTKQNERQFLWGDERKEAAKQLASDAFTQFTRACAPGKKKRRKVTHLVAWAIGKLTQGVVFLRWRDISFKITLAGCPLLKMYPWMLRCVQLIVIPWTVAHQAPLSVEISRKAC